MSADVFPQARQGFGTTRVVLVPTLANPKAPTLAELTNSANLNVTPYFRAESFQINHEQGKINDTRLSDSATREALGISSYAIDALSYLHDPQDTTAGGSPGNKLYYAATPGSNQYLVIRYGKPSEQALAAADRIAVFSVQFGNRHQPIPVGEDSTQLITQPVTVSREIGDYKIPVA